MRIQEKKSSGFSSHSQSSIPISSLILILALTGVFFVGAMIIDSRWISVVQEHPLTSNVIAGIFTVPLGLLLGIFLIDQSRERKEEKYWASTQEVRIQTVTKYLFRLARVLVNEFTAMEEVAASSSQVEEHNPKDFERVMALAAEKCINARQGLAAQVSVRSSSQVPVFVAVIASLLEAIAETDTNHWVNGESEKFREWSIRFDRLPTGPVLNELQEEIAVHLAMSAKMLNRRS